MLDMFIPHPRIPPEEFSPETHSTKPYLTQRPPLDQVLWFWANGGRFQGRAINGKFFKARFEERPSARGRRSFLVSPEGDEEVEISGGIDPRAGVIGDVGWYGPR